MLLEQQLSLISIDFLINAVLNRVLVFHTGEQDVGEEEDLRYGESQCYPEIKIGVRRPGVDPLMPHGRREDGTKQYETTYDKSLLHVYKKTEC